MGRKKLVRKSEPSSKRRRAWPRWTGFRGMTLRDWLGLIIVPLIAGLFVVGLTAWFNEQQNDRQQRLEDQRAKAERDLERQRTENEALQSYLDQMSHLMLEKNLPDSEEGSPERVLARARTLTVLESLDDSRRKWSVLQFLHQSELILNKKPVVRLAGADLTEINFNANLGTTAKLPKVNFDEAYLRGSQLKEANLAHAYMRYTKLAEAQLEGADLKGADLTGAEVGSTKGWKSVGNPLGDFETADLSGADLSDATLREAFLPKVDMSPLHWGREEKRTDLSDANLRYAIMDKANLRDAILNGADFTCANLAGADFTGAKGIKWKLLENEAANLSEAIKPDGTTYDQQQTVRRCSEEFEPAMSFSASKASWRPAGGTTDGLSIIDPEGNQLTFSNPRRVVDPITLLSDPKEVSAPESTEEWVSWFQSHPYLDTSEPVQVSVGGASGVRIDVTDRSVPKNYPEALADYCGPGPPCVPLFPYGSNRLMTSSVGNKDQFVIVDVEGEPVVIDVVAPADKFDEFLPKAQKVLDTVEWRGW